MPARDGPFTCRRFERFPESLEQRRRGIVSCRFPHILGHQHAGHSSRSVALPRFPMRLRYGERLRDSGIAATQRG